MKLSEIKTLNEAAKQFAASDFPLVVDNLNDYNRKLFDKGIDKLNAALKDGELNATEFKDIKRYINDSLHDAHREAIGAKYYHGGKYESIPDDLRFVGDLGPEIHRAAGSLKKIEKIKDKSHSLVKDSLAFFNEIKPLTDAGQSTKDMVVKKKKAVVDKEQAAEKETKSTMSHADVKKVRTVLTKVTQKLHDGLYDRNVQWLQNVVKEYRSQYDPDDRKTGYLRKYSRDPYIRGIVGKVVDFKSGASGESETMKPGYNKILKDEAERMTKDVLDRFISKNTDKLGAIVKNKNNLNQVELIRASAGRGVVEGLMRLTFGDKSSFEVNNKIVGSYSKLGKPFHRFPTTFHNVKMSDGSKMGQPSESKMKKEF